MSKWIPVTERLPEMHPEQDIYNPWMQINMVADTFLISDFVLVTGRRERADDDDPPILLGRYEDDLDGRTYWNGLNCENIVDVTAWMPLPEPYEEGNK